MATLRFNVFQRVVRTWDQTHPYNAAQLLRLDRQRAGDPARWREAWPEALRSLGLGRVVIKGNTFEHTILQHPQAVEVIPPGRSLEAHIGEALNAPFTSELPFRPFVGTPDDTLDVGVIYQHWIADSVSIRMLLERWFDLATGGTAVAAPIRLARGGYWSHFGPGRVPWQVDSAIGNVLRSFSRFRSVCRLRSAGSRDYTKAVLLRTAPAGLVPSLVAFARARGATVNDLFVAAALEQCARHLPLRSTPSRTRIAMGTIVDLRPLDPRPLHDAFGLFLGFTNVTAPLAEVKDFDRLLHRVAAQSRHARTSHAAASGMLWLFASVATARFLRRDKTYHFYRKHMPLAGGISNVNLNRSWAAAHHPHLVRQYVRFSPTGPMIPVAFTPTTLGQDLHLAMTYRSSILTAASAAAMADGFLDRLVRLAGL